MAPKPRPAIDRFRGLIELRDDGCMAWTGYIHSNGYAKHWVDGRHVLAHRWSYEHHIGPIPEGLQIDHLCRNRACVNPEHLEPVTPAENVRRGTQADAARARGAEVTHCPQDHPYDEANTVVSKDGSRVCRACKRASARDYYERNRQVVIERADAWRRDNPDRARELARERQRRYRAKKKAS